jgi:hypothetical protein
MDAVTSSPPYVVTSPRLTQSDLGRLSFLQLPTRAGTVAAAWAFDAFVSRTRFWATRSSRSDSSAPISAATAST